MTDNPVFLDGNQTGPIRYVPYGTSYGENIYEVVGTATTVCTYPYSFSSTNLTSDNANVTSFAQNPNVSSAYAATAVGGGTTYISYLYSYENPYPDPLFYDCQYPGPTTGEVGGNGGVQISTSAAITNNDLHQYNNSNDAPCGDSPDSGIYGYARCLSYQVKDQNGNDLEKRMAINETLTTVYTK